MLEIDNGTLTAKTNGSGEFRVAYLDQEVVADVEVYAIVEGRFNQDVMCVLTERGTVRCWGDQWRPLWGYGQRTWGFVGPPDVGDMPLGGLAVQFRLGFSNECVRTLAGDVRCWGSSTGGLLGYGNHEPIGDNETLADAGPVPIGISGRVVDIGGGDDFVCAVFDSGRVRCWGSNHAGQLGMGHQDQINVGDDETPADMDSDVLLGGRAVQVAGGRYKACALSTPGRCGAGASMPKTGTGRTRRSSDAATAWVTGSSARSNPLATTNLRLRPGTWNSPGQRRRSRSADTTCAPSWTMARCGAGAWEATATSATVNWRRAHRRRRDRGRHNSIVLRVSSRRHRRRLLAHVRAAGERVGPVLGRRL